jgi:Phosphatidylinositol-4-phosphate 5-Kinase
MLRESLLPFNNSRTLIKSFEKTNAKGGKPLIKTHDKRFLIKEVSKEEKDFLMSILPKYHQHLRKHPNSLLAKIVGVYSITIGQKEKVYHVLMESLDPLDDAFIRFKYDLKFSTVNRREYKSRHEVNLVRDELIESNPYLDELFPRKKDLGSLHELPNATGTVGAGFKKIASSNGSGSADNKSKEAKKNKSAKSKTRSTESGTTDKKKSNTNSDSDEDDSDEGNGAMEEDEEEDFENDEKFKQLDYQE